MPCFRKITVKLSCVVGISLSDNWEVIRQTPAAGSGGEETRRYFANSSQTTQSYVKPNAYVYSPTLGLYDP